VFAAYLLKGLKKVKLIETEVKILVASELSLTEVTKRLKALDLNAVKGASDAELRMEMFGKQAMAAPPSGSVRSRGSVTGGQGCYVCQGDHKFEVCPCITCPTCKTNGHLPRNCPKGAEQKPAQKVMAAVPRGSVALSAVSKNGCGYLVDGYKPIWIDHGMGTDSDDE
jgi:hypothetical protein